MSKFTAADWLKNYFSIFNIADFDTHVKNLVSQMQQGLNGQGSIKMLPSYLSSQSKIIKNQTSLVMDAGGSHFRCAFATATNGKTSISNLQEWTMAGITGNISSEELFAFFAEKASTYLSKSQSVGFCFSYPMEINSDIDGKLLRFTKEIKCSEAHGKFIGKETLNAISQYDEKQRKIVLLNDTVATLLGGSSLNGDMQQDCTHIGLVYGTGFNVSVELQTSLITKLGKVDKTKYSSMIINEEAGNYDGFLQGQFDKEIDELSTNCGMQKTEKMVSGRYLGNMLYKCLLQLRKENILEGNIDHIKFISTKQLSRLLENPKYKLSDAASDNNILRSIAKALIDRAAYMVACIICATAYLSQNDKFAITCEGTTFDKLCGFRQIFCSYLDKFMPPKSSYKLLKGNNLNLFGSAFASYEKI